MPNHLLTRVYPNGEAKETVRDDAGRDNWLKYNHQLRPGCALFVNGDLYNRGSLSYVQCMKVMKAVRKEIVDGKHDFTKPDQIGPQIDDGERYEGYRPEPYRERFKW